MCDQTIRGALGLGVAAALALGGAQAQTATVGIDAASAPALWARVDGVRRAGGEVGFGIRLGPRPGVDASGRVDRAFGALGTLVVEGGVALRAPVSAEAAARAEFGARGSFGPAALRLQADAWSAPAGEFDPLADPGLETAPAGTAVRLGGDVRVERSVLLGGELRLERSAIDGATIVDGEASLRLRRALPGGHDLRLRSRGRLADGGTSYVAAGVGIVWQRRRAPEWRTEVGIGMGAGGASPSVAIEGASRLPDGSRLAVAVRAEPFASTRQPYRLDTEAEFGTGEAGWTLAGALAWAPATRPQAALRVTWRRPWTHPALR